MIEVVKSKFLEVLSGALPYKIKPEIASWVVENEVVRINIQVNNALDFYLRILSLLKSSVTLFFIPFPGTNKTTGHFVTKSRLRFETSWQIS